MYSNDQEHEIALRKALNRYNQDLVFMALRLTGNLDDANRIVVDVFKMAYDEHMDLSEESGIQGILYRTVKFRCIDFLRRRTTFRKKLQKFFNIQQSEADISNHDLIEVETEMAKKFDRIMEAVYQLPEARRKAIIAIILEGRPVAEYAESEGIAYSTACNNKNQGLKQLRKILGKNSIPLLLILSFLYQDFRN